MQGWLLSQVVLAHVCETIRNSSSTSGVFEVTIREVTEVTILEVIFDHACLVPT